MNQKEIEKLKNTTVVELAQLLEDGLVHSGWLHEEMSVYDFIKTFYNEWYGFRVK